jgi:cytochrome P450
MVRAVPAIRRDPLAFLVEVQRRHGDHVAIPLPRTPVLLVGTPAGARDVLVTGAASWGKSTPQYGALSAVTGSGLLTSDGSHWRERRRTVQPAFAHGALTGVAAESVAAGARLAGLVGPGPAVRLDVEAALLQATLEVVGRTLFGTDVADDGERLVQAVLRALEQVVGRVRTPLPTWLPTPGRRRLRQAVAELDRASARVVGHRRAAGRGEGQDLLGLLLDAVDAGTLDPRGLRDELVTMVIAGHETVASSLSWTAALLAAHPGAQERLHAELDEVLEGPGGRDPGRDDLARLPWTRAVVDEALRLYPPAWVLSRRATTATTVDGVDVPAGTLAVLSPWLLHRREETFADAGRFDPERFVGASRTEGYLPFGTGARMCIGRDFALVESVLLLARWLRDVRLQAAGPVPAPDALVTVRPRGGAPLLVSRR